MKITRPMILSILATATMPVDGKKVNKGASTFVMYLKRTTVTPAMKRLYDPIIDPKTKEIIVPAGTMIEIPKADPIRRLKDRVGVVIGVYDRKTGNTYIGSSLTNVDAGDRFNAETGIEMALNRAFGNTPPAENLPDLCRRGEAKIKDRITRMIAAEANGTAKKRRKRRVSGVGATKPRTPRPPQVDPDTGLVIPRRGPGRPRKNPVVAVAPAAQETVNA